jgi:hypothetical protein
MNAITVFGVLALTFMMVAYSLERRHRGFTLAFAFGCLLSSVYGFLIGAWPLESWRSSGVGLRCGSFNCDTASRTQSEAI